MQTQVALKSFVYVSDFSKVRLIVKSCVSQLFFAQ